MRLSVCLSPAQNYPKLEARFSFGRGATGGGRLHRDQSGDDHEQDLALTCRCYVDYGCAVGVGVVAGVVTGAIVGSAIANSRAYAVQPGYAAYPGYAVAGPVECPG